MTDDFEADVEELQDLDAAKRQNARLSRELYAVKHRHADYLATVEQAVTDAVSRISIAPVPEPPSVRTLGGFGSPEHAIALLSDLQTGKLTPDYNSAVARERVMRYAEKIVRITEVQRADHPVDEITVCMLGDMIEGVDIFPGQQWLIDSTLYDQLFNTTPALLVEFLRILLASFERVRVLAVDGNHGRIGRKGQFGPMDNADRMLYRIVAMLLRDEPRFELRMTDPQGERNWALRGEWGNYSALLVHGDQFRGHSGIPFYGFQKKVNGWASGGLGRDFTFQDVFCGHWHQLAKIPLNQRSVYVNGSTESYNTFAQETLAAQSEPSQWLFFCDPEAGYLTASYEVRLK